MQSISSIGVRKRNTDAVYRFIYSQERVSVRDIMEGLDLSIPTVNQHLKQLQALRLVTSRGVMRSTGGRKARAYSIDTGSWVTLGLDVTLRSVSLVAINLPGRTVHQRCKPLPFRNCSDYYREVGRFVAEETRILGAHPQDVMGIGISLPAILSGDGQFTVNAAPLGEMYIPLSAFAESLSAPCSLHNDANAGGYAAFFSMHTAQAYDKRHLAYLSVSDTVGGSIMIGGRMYPGMQQHSAEFGHMTLYPGGMPCYCGQCGCAYAYLNTARLSPAAGGGLEAFFRLLEQGDAGCMEKWEAYLDDLTLLVNNIRAALDCEVIIGGYLGRFIGPHMQTVQAKLAARNMFEKTGGYASACSQIEHISAVGAAMIHQHTAVRQLIARADCPENITG
jgi:predicted NBD/HSP70 family sugar kinase